MLTVLCIFHNYILLDDLVCIDISSELHPPLYYFGFWVHSLGNPLVFDLAQLAGSILVITVVTFHKLSVVFIFLCGYDKRNYSF